MSHRGTPGCPPQLLNPAWLCHRDREPPRPASPSSQLGGGGCCKLIPRSGSRLSGRQGRSQRGPSERDAPSCPEPYRALPGGSGNPIPCSLSRLRFSQGLTLCGEGWGSAERPPRSQLGNTPWLRPWGSRRCDLLSEVGLMVRAWPCLGRPPPAGRAPGMARPSCWMEQPTGARPTCFSLPVSELGENTLLLFTAQVAVWLRGAAPLCVPSGTSPPPGPCPGPPLISSPPPLL